MKTRWFPVLLTIFTSMLLLCCGPPAKKFANGEYKIDRDIRASVDSALHITQGDTFCTWNFAGYRNDSLIWDTSGETILNYASLHGDTLILSGASRDWIQSGYRIKIYRDTCMVYYHEATDTKDGAGFRLTQSDDWVGDILIPCKYHLTLAKKPKMEEGEQVEGVVDLQTSDYYAVTGKRELRVRVALKAHFRARTVRNTSFGQ